MSKMKTIGEQIRGLKPGGSFTVANKKYRALARDRARALRDAGVINFGIVTRPSGEEFEVLRIN